MVTTEVAKKKILVRFTKVKVLLSQSLTDTFPMKIANISTEGFQTNEKSHTKPQYKKVNPQKIFYQFLFLFGFCMFSNTTCHPRSPAGLVPFVPFNTLNSPTVKGMTHGMSLKHTSSPLLPLGLVKLVGATRHLSLLSPTQT